MEKIERPDWAEYFLRVAKVIASRSTCPRASVGVVITKNNRIISTGYNGSLAGEPHCIDNGCNIIDGHCANAIHAEINAIGYAARDGIQIEGSTIYIYDSMYHTRPDSSPCPNCRKVMAASGITSIIIRGDG